ncbi:Uncharacterised protein [Chlamydia trachomatis]|nr:Uncharacterised protein [Chlamydia trachomatis]
MSIEASQEIKRLVSTWAEGGLHTRRLVIIPKVIHTPPGSSWRMVDALLVDHPRTMHLPLLIRAPSQFLLDTVVVKSARGLRSTILIEFLPIELLRAILPAITPISRVLRHTRESLIAPRNSITLLPLAIRTYTTAIHHR